MTDHDDGLTATPGDYDPPPEHHPILEYASGAWWASCTCRWDSGQPMPTEMAATDEWVYHQQVGP